MSSQRHESDSEASRKIEIEHLMPGADVIHVGDEQIALGFPEEVVKAWLGAGKQISAWIIPDVRSAHGIAQWSLEFPLYYALFVQGAFAQQRKIPVLVRERDWADVVTYLRLTLLGLTDQEMKAEGVSEQLRQRLLTEGEHLALKHADGSVAQIEDFLEPRFFSAEGVVEYGALRVKAHGDNTYSIFAPEDRIEEYRLEPAAPQPPYTLPLAPATSPVLPQPFEVTTLGTSNGFDPSGPCSSVLVQTNGRFLLTDAGPYVCQLLDHAGVSPNQIDAVVITHAHEDHAVGLSALLELNHRLRLFVTRETAAILRRKLAILNPGLSHPERLLDDAFDLALVEPERDYDFYGLRLRFHYTMHTIPCTGVELSMRDGGEWRKVLVVGDHNSRANVEQAAAEGVIDAARLERLLALYTWQGDLLIADAGAGLIHGMPNDFSQTPAHDLIFLHTPALKETERHLFTLAKPGFRYAIIPEQRRPSPLERGLAHKAMAAAFPDASADWLNALLDAAQPLSVNRGHVVIRNHAQTQEVYVTLTGELEVLVDAGDDGARAVATVRAGELFGEMAAITGAPRSASVVARTPARLLCIPDDLFTRFAAETELAARLPDVWRKRTALQTVGFLSDSSVSTRMRLAHHAVRRSIQPGATLIREGSKSNAVFVLVQGRVQVYKGEEPLLVNGAPIIVNPGTLIGETAPFLRKARNASIVTLDECEVLAIPGADFKRIISDSPQLYCSISHMVRERAAA